MNTHPFSKPAPRGLPFKEVIVCDVGERMAMLPSLSDEQLHFVANHRGPQFQKSVREAAGRLLRKRRGKLDAVVGATAATTRVLVWKAVKDEVPDSDATVLIACDTDEPVWLGYHDGETWRTVDGAATTVTHWAELPEPPAE